MDIAIRELALELGDAGGGDSGKSPMPVAARAAAEPYVGQRRAAPMERPGPAAVGEGGGGAPRCRA